MNTPTITVLMSVYNDKKFVANAIESILIQTFTDFEFIIVNDGSTDGSQEILLNYDQQDNRIKLINQPNQGLTKALQEALQHASGKYIVRMDGDDIALSERFEHQLQFMEANPDCVCSGTNVLLIDEDSDPIGVSDQFLKHSEIEEQLLTGSGSAIFHPTMIAKASAMKFIGGYNEKYRTGQDLDLFLRLAEVGKLANTSTVTVKFRRYHNSTTALIKNSSAVKRREEIIKNALKRRGKNTHFAISKSLLNEPQTITEYNLLIANRAAIGGYSKNSLKHLSTAFKNSPIDFFLNVRLVILALVKLIPYSYDIYKKVKPLVTK